LKNESEQPAESSAFFEPFPVICLELAGDDRLLLLVVDIGHRREIYRTI
jgi:hypothetical protein